MVEDLIPMGAWIHNASTIRVIFASVLSTKQLVS